MFCEISGALHLAQPGLTAGWLAGRPHPGNFRVFQSWLQIEIFDFSSRLTKVQRYYSINNAVKVVFRLKRFVRRVIRSVKIREAIVFLGDPYY